MNTAVIMGRLTDNPELKETNNGIPVTSFCVAVNKRYSKGEEQGADFLDCVAWRKTAEFVTKYFHKGSMIGIEGHLQTRVWEDKNGNKRKSTEIVADNVSFCGGKNENNNSSGAPAFDTMVNTDENEEWDLPF